VILANVRERLNAADIDLAVELLAGGDGGRRQRLTRLVAEQGIDALLDRPDLLERLENVPGLGSPSPALFFYVAARRTLLESGIDDAALSDYVASLLYEFGLRQRAHRIAPHDDEVYRYLIDIVLDIETESSRRGFLLRAHLGNFSLWLAGVFPDYVTARREQRGGPDFSYYEAMGATGYRLARDHQLARRLGLAVENLVLQPLDARTGEGQLSRKHLREDNAHRPDVGS
jgi:hypothetical protein